MGRAKRKDFNAMARAWAKTGTLRDAMLAGGYPESMANRGYSSMSHTDRAKYEQAKSNLMDKRLADLVEVGQSVTAEQQENLVRGRLLRNVAEGRDKATVSAKLLGQDRRVNLFTPEQQLGIINVVLQHQPDAVPVLELPPEE